MAKHRQFERILILFPIMVLACGLAGCCVEGYPVLRERDVIIGEVPARVRVAFERGYDVAQIKKIEQTMLMSRCVNYPSKFRFHLAGGQTITLDDDGQLARWRDGRRGEESDEKGWR